MLFPLRGKADGAVHRNILNTATRPPPPASLAFRVPVAFKLPVLRLWTGALSFPLGGKVVPLYLPNAARRQASGH